MHYIIYTIYNVYIDTTNRLNHVIVPPKFLPIYTPQDAGYTATDYILKNYLINNPLCQWIAVTNGDNAYGSDIIENTLNTNIDSNIYKKKISSNINNNMIPDMILQPFSSRNLAEKHYVERKLQWNGDFEKVNYIITYVYIY